MQRYLEMHCDELLPAGVALMASVPPFGINAWPGGMLTTAPRPAGGAQPVSGQRALPPTSTKPSACCSADVDRERLSDWVRRFQPESMRAIFDLSMISLFPVSHPPAVPALVPGAPTTN